MRDGHRPPGGNVEGDTLELDRADPDVRYRYVCPRGHAQWEGTNGHLWCRSCHRRGKSATWRHLRDKKTGRRIPWSRVEIVD